MNSAKLLRTFFCRKLPVDCLCILLHRMAVLFNCGDYKYFILIASVALTITILNQENIFKCIITKSELLTLIDISTLLLITLINVGLSRSKKFRASKMMKNAFYFISKPLFVLKIFKFLSWLFGHVEKTTRLEILKFMQSQPG